MIVKRPSIFIYTHNSNTNCLKEICAGIEEEGVFYEIFENEIADAEKLAFDAAAESMLGCGIGISSDTVVLQLKGTPNGKNIEKCTSPDFSECRKIGANGARIIKKMPLK